MWVKRNLRGRSYEERCAGEEGEKKKIYERWRDVGKGKLKEGEDKVKVREKRRKGGLGERSR